MATYPKGRTEYYISLIKKGQTREIPKNFYDYAVVEGLLVFPRRKTPKNKVPVE